RGVEPDRDAVVVCDECTVARDGPSTAAEGDDARACVEGEGEGGSFDLAEVRFAVFVNDRGHGATFACGDKLVEVEPHALKSGSERAGNGRFADAHEAGDDDARLGRHCSSKVCCHRSSTESKSTKNSGKEMRTESAPARVDLPLAMSAATAQAMAMRWSP